MARTKRHTTTKSTHTHTNTHTHPHYTNTHCTNTNTHRTNTHTTQTHTTQMLHTGWNTDAHTLGFMESSLCIKHTHMTIRTVTGLLGADAVQTAHQVIRGERSVLTRGAKHNGSDQGMSADL